jgi:hypothetical protein
MEGNKVTTMSKEETKKAPKEGAKEATKDSAKAAPDQNLGFEFEFLPLAEGEEGSMVHVAPKDLLVSKVDARDMLSPPRRRADRVREGKGDPSGTGRHAGS